MFWTVDTFVSSFVSPRIVETRETSCVKLFDEAGLTKHRSVMTHLSIAKRNYPKQKFEKLTSSAK